MKPLTLCLLGTAAFLPGCALLNGHPPGHRPQITYYDRNGDRKVDLEKHRHPGTADADWVLRDDNFDGSYEKKILYGVGVKETSVQLVVPTGVPMESLH